MTRHVTFLHPELSFSGPTQRMLSTAQILVSAGHRVSLITRSLSRRASAEAAGVEVHNLEMNPPAISRPFLRRRLRELLESLAPDRLHVTDTRLAKLCTPVIRQLQLPYTLEAPRPVGEPVPFDPALLEAISIPSMSFEERLINGARLPRTLFRYLPNSPEVLEAGEDCADVDTAAVRHLSAGDEHMPTIGCTGHFDEGHAHDWFLDAVRLLVRSGKKWRFLLIGEGPHGNRLRRKIRELDLEEHVTVGVPTTHTARRTLASLDIHVGCRIDTGPGWLTSQTMRLGIPNVIAAVGEAFALVKDQRTGILVKPGDSLALADALSGLVNNPGRARSLGEAGREHSLEHAPRIEFERACLELHGGVAPV
jgi:glycosyltransferase involved in cell wall biosynthesis